MILFYFAILSLQEILAQTSALITGFVMTFLLVMFSVSFIRSIFSEEE